MNWSKNDFEKYLYSSLEDYINCRQDNQWVEEIFYSIKAGGKRFRPALCYNAGVDLGLTREALYTTGCAVELIHTASLIHDDLPEIDNDDYRRGIPSHHIKYGQGNAVIAADFIFFLAFKYISRLENTALNKYFSDVAMDLVYGEYLDIRYENNKESDLNSIREMYKLKTARLIQFPLVAAALLSGKNNNHIEKLSEAGEILGITFQMMDDIKGIEGNFNDIGKTPGKDLEDNKATVASLLGKEQAKQMILEGRTKFFTILSEIKDIDGTDYKSLKSYISNTWKLLENK